MGQWRYGTIGLSVGSGSVQTTDLFQSSGWQALACKQSAHNASTCRCHAVARSAGYAADGYARAKGVGCCVVTFTVGGLSAINAIAGADALPGLAQLRCTPATCSNTGIATAMRRVPTRMHAATPPARQTVSLPPTLPATNSTGRGVCGEPAPYLYLWRTGEPFTPTFLWPGTAQRAGCRDAWGMPPSAWTISCSSVRIGVSGASVHRCSAPHSCRTSSSAALLYECPQTERHCVVQRTPAQNSNDFASNRLIHHTLGRKFDFMQARPRCHSCFLAEA